MKNTLLDTTVKNWRSPWIIGQLFVWGFVIAGSFISAIFLRYTDLQTSSLPLITIIINAVAILSGGFISGRKAGQKGWYYGGLQGIIYSFILLMISFLAFDSSLSLNPLLFSVFAFGIGSIGGILGVNTAD